MTSELNCFKKTQDHRSQRNSEPKRLFPFILLIFNRCRGFSHRIKPEEHAIDGHGLQNVKIGMYLPHELMASFYHFRSGDLFFANMTGLPTDGYINWPRIKAKRSCHNRLRIWRTIGPTIGIWQRTCGDMRPEHFSGNGI